MSNLSHLLAQLDGAADGMGGLSSYEEVFNYATSKGMSGQQASALAREAMLKPAIREEIVRQSRGGQPVLSGPVSAPIDGNVGMAANFVIKALRETASITEPLPIAILGTLDAENSYQRALRGLLPAGVTFTFTKNDEEGVFTFTQGANSDIVRISCQQAPYPNILQAMTTDRIETNKLRLTLSDSSRTVQFGYDLDGQTRNLFGTVVSNPLTPDSFKSPEQYQAGIVDIDAVYKFDKQSLLVTKIAAFVGFSVNYSFMARRFSIHGVKGW